MDVKEIIRLYKGGKSIRQIAKIKLCSATKIRNFMIKNEIALRTKGEGLSKYYENNIKMSKYSNEVITGELIGDAYIKPNVRQSCLSFCSKHKSYCDYLFNIFDKENLCKSYVKKVIYYHKYHNKYYTIFKLRTVSTIQIHHLRSKWYKNNIKIIPDDFKLTPTVMLHWYMGDGTLPKGQYGVLCVDCFTNQENKFLSNLINKEIGIKSSIIKSLNRIFIPKTSMSTLLDYMGACPIKEFNYKWDLKPIGRIIDPIHIDKNKLESLYIKQDMTQTQLAKYFNCSKSLINKKLRKYNIRKRK